MMKASADPDENLHQDLAQFEPDPDGQGSRDPSAEAEALAAHSTGSEQWIEWPDEVRESAWAAAELRSLTAL
jgi:hypothetical protein